MSGSSVELRGGWHRARIQLGKVLRFLRAWGAERRNALDHSVAHAGRDSSKRWSAPRVDSNGEPSERARKLFGTVQDVTEHKREEERRALSRNLQESNARLEQAQRLAHIGYYEWNLITGCVTWSDELYRIYGLSPQAGPIDMAMVSQMIHPDDRERVFREADEAARAGVPAAAEH